MSVLHRTTTTTNTTGVSPPTTNNNEYSVATVHLYDDDEEDKVTASHYHQGGGAMVQLPSHNMHNAMTDGIVPTTGHQRQYEHELHDSPAALVHAGFHRVRIFPSGTFHSFHYTQKKSAMYFILRFLK